MLPINGSPDGPGKPDGRLCFSSWRTPGRKAGKKTPPRAAAGASASLWGCHMAWGGGCKPGPP